MGRGNRNKKKTNNVFVLDLIDEIKENNPNTSDTTNIDFNEAVTAVIVENSENNENTNENENINTNENENTNENINTDGNINENINTIKNSNENINTNELEPITLYDKMNYVNYFVDRYWRFRDIYTPIEGIEIEFDESDNDFDDYYNDDY